MPERPIAVDAYDALAEAYAAGIDHKPHNAMYERPATLSLLPDVHHRRVLDAGCGPGVYTEWLLDQGASVVAIDASERMVAIATRRTGGRAEMHCADLASPLPFLDDASLDLVICPLVLEYLRDWRPVFAEFHRVLRPGGHVVISVSHPFHDADYFDTQAYFDTELVRAEWSGFAPVRISMPSYRRSLAETLNPILEAGFHVETVLEPLPTEQFRVADPRRHARLMHRPAFLCIRAARR